MKNFDWKSFADKGSKIAVWCKTEEEAKDFCKRSHEHLLDWCGGESRLNKILWEYYKEKTCYDYNGYCSKDWSEEHGYTILEWSDYMQTTKIESKSMTDIEIFDMLKPKFEKNGIKTDAPTVAYTQSFGEIFNRDYKEELKKAVALAYSIGYGRAKKGKDFEIENPQSGCVTIKSNVVEIESKPMAKELRIGARVKMVRDYSSDSNYKNWCPPVGVCGTVLMISGDSLYVAWDSGVDFSYKGWYCSKQDVEVVG